MQASGHAQIDASADGADDIDNWMSGLGFPAVTAQAEPSSDDASQTQVSEEEEAEPGKTAPHSHLPYVTGFWQPWWHGQQQSRHAGRIGT